MLPSGESSPAPLGEAISCERLLQLDWLPLAAPPAPADYERWHEDDLRVLAAVALLDESRQAAAANDDPNSLEGEVGRLHQKLNLVIDLLSLLIAQGAQAAPERRVRLSARGLVWSGEPCAGFGLLSLRLHRGVPRSFAWPAQIAATGNGEVQARFEPMREPLQAALERYVFLHHRRAIAGNRRTGG